MLEVLDLTEIAQECLPSMFFLQCYIYQLTWPILLRLDMLEVLDLSEIAQECLPSMFFLQCTMDKLTWPILLRLGMLEVLDLSEIAQKCWHTCDQTRYRRDLPILGPQVRVMPDRPKLPIYMKSDFSLLPKAKTCLPITADACFI